MKTKFQIPEESKLKTKIFPISLASFIFAVLYFIFYYFVAKSLDVFFIFTELLFVLLPILLLMVAVKNNKFNLLKFSTVLTGLYAVPQILFSFSGRLLDFYLFWVWLIVVQILVIFTLTGRIKEKRIAMFSIIPLIIVELYGVVKLFITYFSESLQFGFIKTIFSPTVTLCNYISWILYYAAIIIIVKEMKPENSI